jgi:hypothetical protein
MTSQLLRSLGVSVVAAAFAFGCAPGISNPRGQDRDQGQYITAEEIQRTGATTAWEAVRNLAKHMHFREDRFGQPVRATRRGKETVLLREDPLVVVDGVVSEFRVLRQFPARDISGMRILTGSQGTARYGMQAANGAIVIETRRAAAQTTGSD